MIFTTTREHIDFASLMKEWNEQNHSGIVNLEAGDPDDVFGYCFSDLPQHMDVIGNKKGQLLRESYPLPAGIRLKMASRYGH